MTIEATAQGHAAKKYARDFFFAAIFLRCFAIFLQIFPFFSLCLSLLIFLCFIAHLSHIFVLAWLVY